MLSPAPAESELQPLAPATALKHAARRFQVDEAERPQIASQESAQLDPAFAAILIGMRLPVGAGLQRQRPMLAAPDALCAKRRLAAPAIDGVVILFEPRRGDKRPIFGEREFKIERGFNNALLFALACAAGPDFLPAVRRAPSAADRWRWRQCNQRA